MVQHPQNTVAVSPALAPPIGAAAAVDITPAEVSPSDLTLIWGLRLLGIIDMLALIAVVMPLEWMSRVNDLCGLGPFPDSRIVGYLARTTSALYALHGALVIFISGDVVRYRPLITFLSIAAIVHGVILLGIDLSAGMPFFWTLLEAPSFAATGVVVLWLQHRKCPTKNSISA
ncbi:MAG: hypothetical protein V4719_24675 [Planctomycetota bacterium]